MTQQNLDEMAINNPVEFLELLALVFFGDD